MSRVSRRKETNGRRRRSNQGQLDVLQARVVRPPAILRCQSILPWLCRAGRSASQKCRYAALADEWSPITESGRMAISGQIYMATDGQILLSADRWMRTYWLARLDNTPVAFSEDDASALIGWTTNLASSYEEAVEVAIRHTVQLSKTEHFVQELETRHKPAEATGRLLLHALIGSTPPFWDCRSLQAIVAEIKPQLDADMLTRIKNEAVRLGCTAAHTW